MISLSQTVMQMLAPCRRRWATSLTSRLVHVHEWIMDGINMMRVSFMWYRENDCFAPSPMRHNQRQMRLYKTKRTAFRLPLALSSVFPPFASATSSWFPVRPSAHWQPYGDGPFNTLQANVRTTVWKSDPCRVVVVWVVTGVQGDININTRVPVHVKK